MQQRSLLHNALAGLVEIRHALSLPPPIKPENEQTIFRNDYTYQKNQHPLVNVHVITD